MLLVRRLAFPPPPSRILSKRGLQGGGGAGLGGGFVNQKLEIW